MVGNGVIYVKMSAKLFDATSVTKWITVLFYVLNECGIEPASQRIKSIPSAAHRNARDSPHIRLYGNFYTCFQSCISSQCYNTTTTDSSTTTTTDSTTTTTATTTTSPTTSTTGTTTTTSSTTTTTSIVTATPDSGSVDFQAVIIPRHVGLRADQEHLACYPQKNFTVATVQISSGTPPYVLTHFDSNNDCYGYDGMNVIFQGETETEATGWYPCWAGTGAISFMEGQNDTIEIVLTDSTIPPKQANMQLKVQIDHVDGITDDNMDNYRCDPDAGAYNFDGIDEPRILLKLGHEKKVSSARRPKKQPLKRRT